MISKTTSFCIEQMNSHERFFNSLFWRSKLHNPGLLAFYIIELLLAQQKSLSVFQNMMQSRVPFHEPHHASQLSLYQSPSVNLHGQEYQLSHDPYSLLFLEIENSAADLAKTSFACSHSCTVLNFFVLSLITAPRKKNSPAHTTRLTQAQAKAEAEEEARANLVSEPNDPMADMTTISSQLALLMERLDGIREKLKGQNQDLKRASDLNQGPAIKFTTKELSEVEGLSESKESRRRTLPAVPEAGMSSTPAQFNKHVSAISGGMMRDEQKKLLSQVDHGQLGLWVGSKTIIMQMVEEIGMTWKSNYQAHDGRGNNSERHVIPAEKMEFPPYDGTTNAIKWLQNCDNYFEDQGNNNLRRLITHKLSWTESKRICKSCFGKADSVNPVGELSNLRHTGTVDEYCNQFEECLGRQRRLTGDQQLWQFCAGLTDSLRKEVEYLRPETIFAVMEYARDNEYKIEGDTRIRTFGGHRAPLARQKKKSPAHTSRLTRAQAKAEAEEEAPFQSLNLGVSCNMMLACTKKVFICLQKWDAIHKAIPGTTSCIKTSTVPTSVRNSEVDLVNSLTACSHSDPIAYQPFFIYLIIFWKHSVIQKAGLDMFIHQTTVAVLQNWKIPFSMSGNSTANLVNSSTACSHACTIVLDTIVSPLETFKRQLIQILEHAHSGTRVDRVDELNCVRGDLHVASISGSSAAVSSLVSVALKQEGGRGQLSFAKAPKSSASWSCSSAESQPSKPIGLPLKHLEQGEGGHTDQHKEGAGTP
ncbi:unnamed protein product [Thlaspi arvense]|uniref:Retrotransposon gag domain-containing protein n=1 Tax=Thlaspi arvense TaxID=13288 RepID=A0AAU9RVI8_THLAR|nr:unnamed protein product [Thlaspi arvense]